jgi:hypothetical protein
MVKTLIAGSLSSVSFYQDKFGSALLLYRKAPISGKECPLQIFI